MSEKNDKYVMFRNYMANELEISKEDIRQWIDNAVKEEAKKMVSNTFKQYEIKDEVKKYMIKMFLEKDEDCYASSYMKEFINKLVEEIKKDIKITYDYDGR